MNIPEYTLVVEIEPFMGATIVPVELALVKPMVTKVEGPYNDNDELLQYTNQGGEYYYYATLNVDAKKINPKQVKWAVAYDDKEADKAFYLFSGKEIVDNRVKIRIKIEKAQEKFKIYAYTTPLPDKDVFVEVKIEEDKIELPMLIARSVRRAGITKGKKGEDLTREDIKNLNISFPAEKDKLKKLLNNSYDELGYTKGWFSNYTTEEYNENREERVTYALEQIEKYNKKTDEKLFDIMINDLDDWARGDLDDNLVAMVDFFKVNTSTSDNYEDDRLTKAIAEHERTLSFINGFNPLLASKINENIESLNDMKVNDSKTQYTKEDYQGKEEELLGVEGLQELKSLAYSDKFSGLGISVNGTQAYNVFLKEFKREGDSYQGKLELEILDHFGLDGTDILGDKFYDQEEFICWYMLQHLRGYKPFITKISINYSFSGTTSSNNLNINRDEN
ncbi:DUF3289 family protein [Aquimarina algiphila]|uniref:DUF3289 family protein n=1 Tax=Aquimarina algiphila TaxID=2047982 RepID=UPI00232D3ABC|nr:DUF3289 family protein [Aquimarina algiphila]